MGLHAKPPRIDGYMNNASRGERSPNIPYDPSKNSFNELIPLQASKLLNESASARAGAGRPSTPPVFEARGFTRFDPLLFPRPETQRHEPCRPAPRPGSGPEPSAPRRHPQPRGRVGPGRRAGDRSLTEPRPRRRNDDDCAEPLGGRDGLEGSAIANPDKNQSLTTATPRPQPAGYRRQNWAGRWQSK